MNIQTDKLIAEMVKKEMSIADVAKASGLSRMCISKIINEKTQKCNIKTVSKIAAALNVDYTNLI